MITGKGEGSHDHRERIMETIEQLRQTVHVLVKTGCVQVMG